MVKDYIVLTNQQTFPENDQTYWKELAESFENKVCNFLLGEIAGFTSQLAFTANNQSGFLGHYGLSFSDLQTLVRQHCPEFLAGLRERVIKEMPSIDCYSRRQNKKIYIYGGNLSDRKVVVHLSGLEIAVHTNHFIVHGNQEEVVVVKNLLDIFARRKGYDIPYRQGLQETGRLVRVDFKTGQRVAIE